LFSFILVENVMDNDFILTRSVKLRNPFQAISIPLTARAYKKGYDGQLLGKADPWQELLKQFPSSHEKIRLLWKLTAHAMMRCPLLRNSKGQVFLSAQEKSGSFRFNASNPQSLHYWVLDRFTKFGYEPEVGAIMDALIGPKDIVVDAGTNSGYFPLFIASRPEFKGMIHAFEPVAGVVEELQDILRDTGFGRCVNVHASALWDRRETGAMRIADDLHTGLAEVHAAPQGTVKLLPLDSWYLAPSFIKADVEGSEYAVFAGARKTIAKHTPAIVYESYIDPQLGPVAGGASPHDLLQDMGYTLFQPCWRKREGTQVFLQPTPVDSVRPFQELTLVPFDAQNRSKGPAKINVLAVHEEKLGRLREIFQTEKWEHQNRPQILAPALRIEPPPSVL
jgi:FkbM family methyltransferase